MTSVSASFFASPTAPAPQGGAGVGTSTVMGGGQLAAGAFGAMLAGVPSGAIAPGLPGGTMPPAPTIATLLASTADIAEAPPVGTRLPCGPLPAIPAAAKAVPALVLGSPETTLVLPGAAPDALEPAPADRVTTSAPKSQDGPREAIMIANFRGPGERVSGPGGIAVAPPIVATRTATSMPIPQADTATPIASAAAPTPAPAPLAALQADSATTLVRVPVDRDATPSTTLVTPRPTTKPGTDAERPKAAPGVSHAGEPPVVLAPASGAAAAVLLPAGGSAVSTKRATISRNADMPADLPTSTDPAEPMPEAVLAPPILAGIIAALPAATKVEAAQPSTRPDAVPASTASGSGGPITNGPPAAVPDDRAAPISDARDHSAPDHRGDGAPFNAAPAADPAVAIAARDNAPAFSPAIAAPPVAATMSAERGIPGIITAQPGQIGQELGVAIAHHVAAGNGATGGGETITLRLDPVDMGRIEVKLSFDDGGTLRAIVSADNPAALDMLRRDSADLGRALADAGVRADAQTLSFDTRTGKDGGSGQPGGQPGQRQSEPKGGTIPGAPEDITPIYRPLRTRGGVDLVA